MDDAIRQGGFTVVDMGNDGKITNVLHHPKPGSCSELTIRKSLSEKKPLQLMWLNGKMSGQCRIWDHGSSGTGRILRYHSGTVQVSVGAAWSQLKKGTCCALWKACGSTPKFCPYPAVPFYQEVRILANFGEISI
jgi:hypothetical protein